MRWGMIGEVHLDRSPVELADASHLSDTRAPAHSMASRL
jgi:hypothetical protein